MVFAAHIFLIMNYHMHLDGNHDAQLPHADTCFFNVALPAYSSQVLFLFIFCMGIFVILSSSFLNRITIIYLSRAGSDGPSPCPPDFGGRLGNVRSPII